MSDLDVLEQLAAAYANVPAPAPSAELSARMDAGWIGSDDEERRDAVVLPIRTRRPQLRYLVAALVATFVVSSGLAVAGELPDGLQRQVSSVVSHLGIDLPSPDDHDPTPAHTGSRSDDTHGPSRGTGDTGAGSSGAAEKRGATDGADSSAGGSLGVVGGAASSTTPPPIPTGPGEITTSPTVPVPTVPGPTLPPPTGPKPTVPPLTLPPTTLPPLTLPPISLPPLLPLPLPGL